MKLVSVNPTDIRIKPTEKKLRKAAAFAQAVSDSILPKEMPLERDIYIKSESDMFYQVKNSIQLALDNIKSGCVK